MNNYRFYLGDMLFPVNPAKMTFKYDNKNKTTTLIDGTEINLLKQPGLTEFSFEALIPAYNYPFAIYENGFRPVHYFINKLKTIKEENKPLYLKVIRKLPNGTATFDNEVRCTLEDYQYVEDAKEAFDINVSIKLKQYNEYKTIKYEQVPELAPLADVLTQAQKQEERKSDKEVPSSSNKQSYTVQSGDNLWTICKKVYGDGSKYKEVANKNGIANPSVISVGQVIVLE